MSTKSKKSKKKQTKQHKRKEKQESGGWEERILSTRFVQQVMNHSQQYIDKESLWFENAMNEILDLLQEAEKRGFDKGYRACQMEEI